MARTRTSSGLRRTSSARTADDYLKFIGGMSGLGVTGSTLSYEQTQDDDGTGTFQGLAGLGDVTVPSITGIDAVDKVLYTIQEQLDTFKLAMTVTTISSLAAAVAGVILVLDSGARK
jgi:hypothetical protein